MSSSFVVPSVPSVTPLGNMFVVVFNAKTGPFASAIVVVDMGRAEGKVVLDIELIGAFVVVFNARTGPFASAVVVVDMGRAEGKVVLNIELIGMFVESADVVVDMVNMGRAEGKVVLDIELIGAIEPPLRFQCWSIPKTGRESDEGLLEKFIPEKSNEFNDLDMPLYMSSAQLKESKGDVDSRNCVIGETGLGDCATPLCGMAGS